MADENVQLLDEDADVNLPPDPGLVEVLDAARKKEQIKELEEIQNDMSRFLTPGLLENFNEDQQSEFNLLLDDISRRRVELGLEPEKGFFDVSKEDLLSGTAKSLPFLGGVAGGMLAGPAAPLLTTAIAGGIGGLAGGAGQVGMEEAIVKPMTGETPRTPEEMVIDIGKETAMGAAGAGVGKAISWGFNAMRFNPSRVAAKIRKSGRELGLAVKKSPPPDRGARFQQRSPLFMGERGLDDQAAIFGGPGRARAEKAQEFGQSAVDEILEVSTGSRKSSIDKAYSKLIHDADTLPIDAADEEVGIFLVDNLEKTLRNRRGFLAEGYDILDEQLGSDVVPDVMLQDAIDLLDLQKSGYFLQSERAIFDKHIGTLKNALSDDTVPFTVGQLKQLRTKIGKSWHPNMDFNEKNAISGVYETLTNLRKEAVERIAHQSGRGEELGPLIAKQRELDSQFAGFLNEVNQFKDVFGLKGEVTDIALLAKLDAMPRANMMKSLYGKANAPALRRLKESELFRPQYDSLRQFVIQRALKKSSFKDGMGVDALKFVDEMNNIPRETIEVFFDKEKTQLIKELQLWARTTPRVRNPDGILESRWNWNNEATALWREILGTGFDNQLAEVVARSQRNRFINMSTGQVLVRSFENTMNNQSVMGFSPTKLFQVPPDLFEQYKKDLMDREDIDNSEKARQVNLLNKKQLGVFLDLQSEEMLKGLTGKERRIMEIQKEQMNDKQIKKFKNDEAMKALEEQEAALEQEEAQSDPFGGRIPGGP